MIIVSLRRTGRVLHLCQSWREVFALDYPIAGVGVYRGDPWVYTDSIGDRDLARARELGRI